MLPFFKTVEELGQVIFLHPHYGVGTEHFGGYGHALFLALGFTFETTTAVSRLICSGMLDSVPDLKLLLAHSGGTLPFLAGRLDSCVSGDPHLQGKLKHDPSVYLKVSTLVPPVRKAGSYVSYSGARDTLLKARKLGQSGC